VRRGRRTGEANIGNLFFSEQRTKASRPGGKGATRARDSAGV